LWQCLKQEISNLSFRPDKYPVFLADHGLILFVADELMEVVSSAAAS
jgi:hypothetical protein